MRELKLYRETARRHAARESGRNVYNPYSLLIHVQFQAQDAAHLALPENTDDAVICQDAEGNFAFMLGFSALGGGDPLM